MSDNAAAVWIFAIGGATFAVVLLGLFWFMSRGDK